MTHAPLSKEDLVDPIVEEVRRIKRQLSEKFGHDLHRMVEDARQRQFSSGHVVMTRTADGRFVPVSAPT